MSRLWFSLAMVIGLTGLFGLGSKVLAHGTKDAPLAKIPTLQSTVTIESTPVLAAYKVKGSDGKIVLSGTTNSSGIQNVLLQNGTYLITVSKTGYQSVMKTITIKSGDAPKTMTFNLKSGASTPGGDSGGSGSGGSAPGGSGGGTPGDGSGGSGGSSAINPIRLSNLGSLEAVLKKIIDLLLDFAGFVALVAIIFGGYQYLTSAGNEDKATAGRRTLIYAVIGLGLIILSMQVVQYVVAELGG